MSHLTDQAYLRTEQYRDASNLNARTSIHQRFSTNDYNWQLWVFDHIDLPACSRILDVGCGPADLWLENEERIPPNWTILLSDLSLGMVQKARHNLRNGSQSFRYCILDAQAIPFPDNSFDAVIANHMLYHVPERDAVLHEFHRVLRSDGYLYAATNGCGHLQELRDLVSRFYPDAKTANVAENFGLENGSAQLSHHFSDVTCHRQENALVVTEAEPLIAYGLSMMCQTARREHAEAFSCLIHEKIAAQGAIHVRKDAGMFVARKA